jgi:hypothetical protein
MEPDVEQKHSDQNNKEEAKSPKDETNNHTFHSSLFQTNKNKKNINDNPHPCITNDHEEIKVNDILDVFCDSDGLIHKAKVLQVENIEKNRISQRRYYIHYLDYEKRMDNWISESSIINKDKKNELSISNNIENLSKSIMLTRKRSNYESVRFINLSINICNTY